MTWFKVDDRFWAHPKVEELEAHGPRVFADAICLWTMAGSYSDTGRVCLRRLRRIVPIRSIKRGVDALVAVGLWHRIDAETIEFHDWTEYQPKPNRAGTDSEPGANQTGTESEPTANRQRTSTLPPSESLGKKTHPTRPDPDPTTTPQPPEGQGAIPTQEQRANLLLDDLRSEWFQLRDMRPDRVQLKQLRQVALMLVQAVDAAPELQGNPDAWRTVLGVTVRDHHESTDKFCTDDGHGLTSFAVRFPGYVAKRLGRAA